MRRDEKVFTCGDGTCLGYDKHGDVTTDCTDGTDKSTCESLWEGRGGNRGEQEGVEGMGVWKAF